MTRKSWFVFPLILFCFSLCSQGAFAATINAASCSLTDVQNAVNAAVSGDTVVVPAGNCTWSNLVTADGRAMTIQGAGAGVTNITLTTPSGGVGGIGAGINPNQFYRITGFTFTTTGTYPAGVIYIELDDETQPSPQFRIDHITLNINGGLGNRGIMIVATYGLIDHVTINNPSPNGQSISISPDGGHSWFRNNWHMPAPLGTENADFIEDSTFNNTQLGDGAFDAYDGTKVVFRHNTVVNTNVGWHGADSDPRSARSMEIYDNTFSTTGATSVYTAIRSRGGMAAVWGNTVTGNYNGFMMLSHYRADPSYGGPPGQSSDGNFDKTYPGQGYPTGYPLLDQIGRGSFPGGTGATGQTIPDCSAGCTTAQYEASEPNYLWNNSINGNTSPTADVANPSQSTTYIVQGRDYFDNTSKPGYVPYTYPHPFQDGGTPPEPPGSLTAVVH
jgi:hypothetical protein